MEEKTNVSKLTPLAGEFFENLKQLSYAYLSSL
jgi:hypothetical protein